MARKAHYIDNKKFYIEMLVYREMVDEARKRGLRKGVPYDEIRLHQQLNLWVSALWILL